MELGLRWQRPPADAPLEFLPDVEDSPGLSADQPPRWRARLPVWRIVLAVAFAWAVWVGWTGVHVRSEARDAESRLTAAIQDLDAEDLIEGDGIQTMRGVEAQFASVDQRLSNPFLAPLRLAPVVGRQLSAASHQASAARTALATAIDVADRLRLLVDSGFASGPARVDALREVNRIGRDGVRVLTSLDLGPDEALIGPLADARARIEEERLDALGGLERLAAVSAGLVTFFEGPTDYLLFAANNSQMQNGQGMLLSVGLLHVEQGRMRLGPMEPTADIPSVPQPVPLDPDLAARWGWLDPNHDFRHLGLSHRFPVTAATAVQIWEAVGRPAVNGVLVVDPFVLRTMVEASGPVMTLAGELGADEIVEYVLHDQYAGYLEADGSDGSYTAARRDDQAAVSAEVINSLEESTTLETSFVEGLAQMARGRHLLAWSADESIQAGWVAAGMDGQIQPSSLQLSLINRSGTKLDWFMRTAAELSIVASGDTYECVVRIEVTNDAPSEGEPAYVVGPYPGSGLDEGDYLGLVTLNLPADATNAWFDDVDRLAVAGADGRNRTISTWVRLPRATSTTLVARFSLSGGQRSVVVEPSARAVPTDWSWGDERWRDDAPRSLHLGRGGGSDP